MGTNLNGTLADYFKQETKMNKLIKILSKINNNELDVYAVNDIIEEIYGDDEDLVLIGSLADELLITDQGHCNWKNIKRLKAAGFDVFAGDKDSFGWLTGCIKTKKGIIVYG